MRKTKKNVKIQCIQAYIGFIINITFAVYALFKSVNLFKYYKQKNYNFGGGPTDGWPGPVYTFKCTFKTHLATSATSSS